MLHPFNALGEHVLGNSSLPADYGAATTGTNITPGASGSEGAWTSMISSTAAESSWCMIDVFASATAGASTPLVLDIGVDPAGGTSYTAVINNLLCGNVGSGTGYGGMFYLFPLRIKAGASVAARALTSAGSAASTPVAVSLYGRSSRPEAGLEGSDVEIVGTITSASGVSFTPGNATWGSWVSLGTSARKQSWWQLGAQLNNATMGTKYYFVELAHGDATNKHTIKKLAFGHDTNERVGEFSRANQMFEMSHWPLPAGTELWVRGMCDTTPDATWTAAAYGAS